MKGRWAHSTSTKAPEKDNNIFWNAKVTSVKMVPKKMNRLELKNIKLLATGKGCGKKNQSNFLVVNKNKSFSMSVSTEFHGMKISLMRPLPQYM